MIRHLTLNSSLRLWAAQGERGEAGRALPGLPGRLSFRDTPGTPCAAAVNGSVVGKGGEETSVEVLLRCHPEPILSIGGLWSGEALAARVQPPSTPITPGRCTAPIRSLPDTCGVDVSQSVERH